MTDRDQRGRRRIIRRLAAERAAAASDPESIAEQRGIALGEARERMRLERIMAAAGGRLDLALVLAFETRTASGPSARLLKVADTAPRRALAFGPSTFAHLNTPTAIGPLTRWQERQKAR